MRPLKKSLMYPRVFIIAFICSVLFLSSFKKSDSNFRTPTTHTVLIQGMNFDPEEIYIKKGDIVEWINKDIVPHDVTKIDKEWTSGTLNSDQKWSKKITKSVDYYCSIHLVMKGHVIVSD